MPFVHIVPARLIGGGSDLCVDIPHARLPRRLKVPPRELLEPYFFNFDGDLYNQTIEVALIEYLRPEAKFDDLDALKAQMALDCDRAREVLAAG